MEMKTFLEKLHKGRVNDMYKKPEQTTGLRAVYYARVSTEEEKQVNALTKQCEEAEHCISSNGWKLVDRYVDEGKSGTTSKRRNEYNRLYDDMEIDKFDIIVIKSQDRLMRNVKDWYVFIDKMVKNGKRLYFYLENKWYESDDALITGIKAILAEEYSRELSKKINNSNKRRQQSGTSIITNGKLWGYNQKDGELTINEEEAKVVRRIFELYISGLGCRGIRKKLTEEGYLTRNATEFAETTIKRMIKNEKYKGTVIFNKQHKDFDTKRIMQNPPEEWIVHENRIPAIIDPIIWEEANRIMRERSIKAGGDNRVDQKFGYNKSKHPLGGKIICSECGKVYYRTHVKSKDRTKFKYVWQCSTYVQKGRIHPWKKPKVKYDNPDGWIGCDGINLEDDKLMELMNEIARDCSLDIEFIIDKMTEYVTKLFESTDNTINIEETQKSMDKINAQKNFLLDKYINGILNDSDYIRKSKELDSKLDVLNVKLEQIQNSEDTKADMENKLQRIKDELRNGIIEEEKVTFIMDRVKKILVYKDHLEVELEFIGNIIASIEKDKSLNVITARPDRYLYGSSEDPI